MAISKFVEFDKSHIDLIGDLKDSDEYAFRCYENWKDAVFLISTSGYTDSLFINDLLMSIQNLTMYWNGVAEIWMVTSKKVNNFPILFFKEANRWIEDMIIRYNLHRLQCKAVVGFDVLHKFLRKLGFDQEAYLSNYGPLKEDYIQYVRLI